MTRRVALALAVVLVAAGVVVTAVLTGLPGRLSSSGCSDEVVSADRISRPFPDEPPDDRLRRLVRAAEGWGVGSPTASIGYDYDRFIDFAALPGRLAVWRKGDPVMAVVDAATGDPVWGIRQSRARHAWDASAERFVMLAAPEDGPVEVTSHGISSGERRWCARLDQPALGTEDPISTSVTPEDDVFVLAGRPGDLRLTSLKGGDGQVRWTDRFDGIDRGDYVSVPLDGVVVVGGRSAYELGDDPSDRTEVLAGVAETDGEVRWRFRVGAGTTASVVGDGEGLVVVREQSSRGTELVGLDHATGAEQWRREVGDALADMAVRGDVILVRTASSLEARAVETGQRLWRTGVRQQPQPFPYGFRLAEQPMLDEEHLLLGATDAIIRLRVTDGRQERWALPTDGVSTTYWPYRIAVTRSVSGPGAAESSTVAVATNTGAVVVGTP